MNGMRNKKLYTGCRKCESRFSCPDAYMEHSHKCNNYEKESEVKSMGDVIHKPDHYCFSEYEPRKVIHSWGLNFNLGNAVKYICRAGRKGDILEDLKKAKEYIGFEIEEIEAERNEANKEFNKQFPEHPNCKCVSDENKVKPGVFVEFITVKHDKPDISELVSMSATQFMENYYKYNIGNVPCFVDMQGNWWFVESVSYELNGDNKEVELRVLQVHRFNRKCNEINLILKD